MKTLAEVKRNVNVGDKVIIRNIIKNVTEEREVTGKNTTGILTYSPTTLNMEKTTIRPGGSENWTKVYGADIKLDWQRARDTRIIDNKVQFLSNKDTMDKYTTELLNEQGLDYWLELELL